MIAVVGGGFGALALVIVAYIVATRYLKDQIIDPVDVELMNDVLSATYELTRKHNKISKVTLMERLNVSPKRLKEIIGMLSKRNLMTEDGDNVKMTKFGDEFIKNIRRRDFDVKNNLKK